MKQKKSFHLFGSRSDQRGQVEVETAIVLPAVVFLLLGMLQLGMLQQARLFAEYAAYKAVRTGALKSVDPDAMRKAARAAALPILAYNKTDVEYQMLGRADSALKWAETMGKVELSNTAAEAAGSDDPFTRDKKPLSYINLTICGPTQSEVSVAQYPAGGDQYVSFDSDKLSGEMPGPKLRIEIVLNYRMIVPFADGVIYRMWKGRGLAESLRLDSRTDTEKDLAETKNLDEYDVPAALGIYIIPIRAQYAMRLQSDVNVDRLPESNACADKV